jgi:hypothetical protein
LGHGLVAFYGGIQRALNQEASIWAITTLKQSVRRHGC